MQNENVGWEHHSLKNSASLHLPICVLWKWKDSQISWYIYENRIVVENSTNFLWEKAYRIKYPDGDCWAIECNLLAREFLLFSISVILKLMGVSYDDDDNESSNTSNRLFAIFSHFRAHPLPIILGKKIYVFGQVNTFLVSIIREPLTICTLLRNTLTANE